jgi:hypothetical protein
MENWQIVLAVVLGAAVIYYLIKRNAAPSTDNSTQGANLMEAAATPDLAARSSFVPKSELQTITPAPGIDPSSGQVPNNPPPPIPYTNYVAPGAPPAPSRPSGGVAGAISGLVGNAARPGELLQHIPVVGSTLATVTRPVSTIVNVPVHAITAVNARVNNALDHIPVVGAALSAPGKAIAKATSWLGF